MNLKKQQKMKMKKMRRKRLRLETEESGQIQPPPERRKKKKPKMEENTAEIQPEPEKRKKKLKKRRTQQSFGDELAELAKADPELYEFLKKEEADLFEPGADDPEEGEDDLEDEAGQEEAMDEDSRIQDEPGSSSEDEIKEIDDLEDEEEEAEQPAQKADASLVLCSGKSLRVRLVPDPSSEHGRRLLVSPELIAFLDAVLREPETHRAALAKAVDVAIKAFIACVARVGGSFKKLAEDGQLEFVVHNGKAFDQVIRLCFQTLGKCLYLLLNPVEKLNWKMKKSKMNKTSNGDDKRTTPLKQKAKRTHFKHWHKYGAMAKRYLEAVHIFLLELQSNQVVVPTIRAVADLVDLYLHFPKLSKTLIKALIRIWSRQHSEEARCIAFLVLCKMARMDSSYFPIIYKCCYVAYVANCKLIEEQTLPSIHFMQRSFVELTFLQPTMAYQHAFVYIRQFAIHLRNAAMGKRNDSIKSVYNWQFLKGLQLWAALVCEGTRRFEGMEGNWFRELAHPLVEIISIMEGLFPSSNYLPLRIHCLRMLLSLQTGCNVFIPTLAYAVELLDELTLLDAKKPMSGKGAVKEVHLDRMLRLSREQFFDAGVRQHVAQQLFALIKQALDVLKSTERAHRSLVVPIVVKLKRFLKSCANREHVRLFAQLKGQMAVEE